MRARIVLTVLLLLLLSACGGSGRPAVIGTWHGTLHQKGLAPFDVTATVHSLKGRERNTVHYSGIDCHGRWTYLGRVGSAYRFREVITGGRSSRCKGTGTVSLTPSGARLQYEFRGGGVVSRGLLSSF